MLVGVASVAVTTRLEFDTRLSALLPESAPEVRELKQVQAKAGGTVELVIAVGGTKARRLPFARTLVAALRTKPYIRRADVEFPVDFFLARRAWMLKLGALKKLQRTIDEEIRQAKARANPFYVDLEDDDDGAKQQASPWAAVDSGGMPDDKSALLKPTFSSPDGKYLFLRVKPKSVVLDMSEMERVLGQVKSLVASLGPERQGLTVRYAGGLVVNAEQHRRMQGDMRRASLLALVLVLLLTSLYIRRPIAPVLLAVPLVIGVAVTLAVTTLTIGQLNLVSGFLVSALIGLGIAFGVHLYMRFLEYLPRAATRAEAMRFGMIAAFPGCFTAAATTAGAFLTMTLSDFRGFREYGQIAAGGVMLTLLATFIVLPPLAVVLSSSRTVRQGRDLRLGFSRGLAMVVVIAGLGWAAFSIAVKPQVGWRNDFKELRGQSDAVEFYEYVQEALGGSLSPAAVMVDSVEDARKVERILKRQINGTDSAITRTISLASMVPEQVAEKGKVLAEIERMLVKVKRSGKLKPEDATKVDEALGLVRAKPWTEHEIPEVFRRFFRSIDRKNTFVLVWPRSELYLDQELFAWAKTLDEIGDELRAAGINALVLDENRIGARVVKEVQREWPKVFAFAALAVLLILAVDFRSPRKVALGLFALGMGLLWIVGGMYLTDIQLNIFNHSAMPMILGIGIDNAVHIQHRYDQEGPGSIPKVVSTTGAAALLASATTAIGFGATITAHHYGVNSLGWLSIIGIGFACVGTTVFFPALLLLIERRREGAAG